MSLLDDKSFSLSLDGTKVVPTVAVGYEESREQEILEKRNRISGGDLSVDVQKMSGFSLRRKKDKQQSHRSQSRTPPDSPQAEVTGGGGFGKKASNIRGVGVASNKGRKQYAALMENDSNGEEDEEDEDNFLLSKGHVAREKRSSSNPVSKPESVPPTQFDDPINETDFHGNTVVELANERFPVRFTPPMEARFPNFEFNFNTGDIASHVTEGDGHVTSEPSQTLNPSPSAGFIIPNDDPSSLPVLPRPSPLTPSLPLFQPSPPMAHSQQIEGQDDSDWSVSDELYQKCTHQFDDLHPENGYLSGEKARDFFIQSKLPVEELSKIWKLSDINRDGRLSQDEFVVAMKLVLMRRKKFDIPQTLPESLVPRERNAPTVPPPITKTTLPESILESSGSSALPPLPFLSSAHRTKTEPTIAVSGATPAPIEHIMVEGKPYARVNLANKINRKNDEENLILKIDDFDLSESCTAPDSADVLETCPLEPTVARLISVDTGEDTTGDEDETSALVTLPGDIPGKEDVPVPKPRRKKHSPQKGKIPLTDLQRSHTVHGRVTQGPPRPPAPYHGRSPLHIVTAPTLSDEQECNLPSPTDDVIPIMKFRESIIGRDERMAKGHGRSTSWDLTKMLREGSMGVHEDVPSAEPPKLPPRRNVSPSSDDESSKSSQTVPILQRSASTGSIASVGQSTTINPLKHSSRSPSIDSGTLLSATESLLPRTGTFSDSNRRPAPAPPVTKPPKPVVPKKPLFPPSYKKVNTPVEKPSDIDTDERTPLSMETYKKKTKMELQKSVRQLKEENEVYSRMNKELSQKLQELVEHRYKLEVKLESFKKQSHTH